MIIIFWCCVVFDIVLVLYCAFWFTGEDPRDGIRSSSTLPLTQPPSAPPTPTHLAGTGSSFESEDRGDLIKFYNTIYVLKVQGFALKFCSTGGQVIIYKITHFVLYWQICFVFIFCATNFLVLYSRTLSDMPSLLQSNVDCRSLISSILQMHFYFWLSSEEMFGNYFYYYYYLLQLGFHPVAVVLTLVHTIQMDI
jgi:hypothetical protein